MLAKKYPFTDYLTVRHQNSRKTQGLFYGTKRALLALAPTEKKFTDLGFFEKSFRSCVIYKSLFSSTDNFCFHFFLKYEYFTFLFISAYPPFLHLHLSLCLSSPSVHYVSPSVPSLLLNPTPSPFLCLSH